MSLRIGNRKKTISLRISKPRSEYSRMETGKVQNALCGWVGDSILVPKAYHYIIYNTFIQQKNMYKRQHKDYVIISSYICRTSVGVDGL